MPTWSCARSIATWADIAPSDAFCRGYYAFDKEETIHTESSYKYTMGLIDDCARSSGPPAPSPPEENTPTEPPAPGTGGQSSALDQAREALTAERYRQAVQLAEIAMKSAAGQDRTECVYITGAAQLAMARSRQAKLDAGLVLMEVVARDERSAFAAAALWRVGTLYEDLGRTAKASELYREARDHPAAADDVRKAVIDALAKIEAPQRD